MTQTEIDYKKIEKLIETSNTLILSDYDKACNDIINTGFYLDLMFEHGFKINIDDDKTPIEQAIIFNEVKSEMEY